MNQQEIEKLREIVFERLVCGESSETLHAHLAAKNGDEADRLISEANKRIAQERANPDFARLVRKIRKRRLVGKRYLEWKILGSIAISLSAISVVLALFDNSPLPVGLGGFFVGGIILGVVEWREHRRINFDADWQV